MHNAEQSSNVSHELLHCAPQNRAAHVQYSRASTLTAVIAFDGQWSHTDVIENSEATTQSKSSIRAISGDNWIIALLATVLAVK